MNLDFTVRKYEELLLALKNKGYGAITFAEYMQGNRPERFVVLRHDVDAKPENSLVMARLEHYLGLKASYYFRAVKESWDEEIIKKIASLGHEVGYHYESLTTCKGDLTEAYKDFGANLKRLRDLVDVKTICMHGSPRSPYDNRLLWQQRRYRELGLIGEPYMDVDYTQVFYLTDTGRRWDGFKVSVRDKIPEHQDRWCQQGWVFHSTDDILEALDKERFPKQVMMTSHPQRWNDSLLPWTKELVMQGIKNVVKSWLIRI